MFRHFLSSTWKKGALALENNNPLFSYCWRSFHYGKPPYTYKKEKKSKNPQKHVSFKQRTIAYMEPFSLDVFISKRFVSASITHRVTSKQVAVADIPACLAVGRILADRAREADVFTATYTPRERDKFEGKIRAVVQSLIDNGIDVKVYLD
ncbi:unnamed protein product [Spirodela intermedia]|uniref:Uncharacterized protein n=1 Tax=Spirodela intermedia TaxID=51605 RepID=A0A7I8JFY7_SPIIN|nr:unnamed protein product [Spirodela intermedia]CAA6669064.1 unnamed protein product [Spirodela intermedia]